MHENIDFYKQFKIDLLIIFQLFPEMGLHMYLLKHHYMVPNVIKNYDTKILVFGRGVFN